MTPVSGRSGRSRMREGVWLLVIVVLVSSMVTLHLNHHLPWMHQHPSSLPPPADTATLWTARGYKVENTGVFYSSEEKKKQAADFDIVSSKINQTRLWDKKIGKTYGDYFNNYNLDNVLYTKERHGGKGISARRFHPQNSPENVLPDNYKTMKTRGRYYYYNSNSFKNPTGLQNNKNNLSSIPKTRRTQASVDNAETRVSVSGSTGQRIKAAVKGHPMPHVLSPTHNVVNSEDEKLREGAEIRADVTTFLQKIEAATLTGSPPRPSVLVAGSLQAVKQHFPLMEAAFHKYNMVTTFKTLEDTQDRKVGGDEDVLADDGDTADNSLWSILICLNITTGTSGSSCVVSAKNSRTKEYQKANVVSGLTGTSSKSCDTVPRSSTSKSESGHPQGWWYGGPLKCFLNSSSSLTSSLSNIDFGCGVTSGLWLIEFQFGKVVNQFVSCSSINQKPWQDKRFSEPVVVPLPSNLLTLNSNSNNWSEVQPLVWQVYVLVTSLSPLRLYLQPCGILWESLAAYIDRKLPKKVFLQDIQELITELHSEEQAMQSIGLLEDTVRQTFMFIENQAMATNASESILLERSFQLFEAIVVFNSTFHPFIIQVVATSYVDGLSSLSKYLVEKIILEDLAALLSSRLHVAGELEKVLLDFELVNVEMSRLCTLDESLCLYRSELIYLLDTYREHWSSKNWRRLCPSVYKSCYSRTSILGQHTLNPLNLREELEKGSGLRNNQSLKEWVQKISAIESIQRSLFHPKTDDRVDIPVSEEQYEDQTDVLHRPDRRTNSSSYSDSVPYLSAIRFVPRVFLQPEFSPMTTEYYTSVSHDTLLIRIQAVARNCRSDALLEERVVNNRWVNFTLGVGENVAHIVVIEGGHPPPQSGLNTYRIRIYRRHHDKRLGLFDPTTTPHQVCSLKQACSLPYSSTDPCGLQPMKHISNWDAFVHWKDKLRQCTHNDTGGVWVVPCGECSLSSSCQWRFAAWAFPACQEHRTWSSQQYLHHCFKDKKVLFLGDSTLRGMSHYLIERVNGSLYDWDKTHNIKVYTHLNGGHTTVGFAYYPQFWLPLHERPLFKVALRKLLDRVRPVSNSSRTVLALGGVQWLSRHHMQWLAEALAQEGLSGITVVVKGLGAGFHQPVSNMQHLTPKDHEKLLSQNRAVLSEAVTRGFLVVDTFNMTMSRYSEFLQGSCACHFQKVTQRQVSMWHKLSRAPPPSAEVQTPVFQVEGDIGAMYSDMMINRICGIR